MKLRYEHIAWDFDGTLYDSYPFVIDCYLKTLKDFGVDGERDKVSELIHKTVRHAHDYYAPLCGRDIALLRTKYKDYEYRLHGPSDRVPPVDGIPELLRDVAAAGGHNHICSNRSTLECRAYLERDGLAQYFDLYVGGEMDVRLKPNGDMFRYLQEHLCVPPEKILMIGDRPLDYLEAHSAGSPGCFFEPECLASVPDDVEYSARTADQLREIFFARS